MLENVDVLERRHPGPDGGGGEHVALGVPATIYYLYTTTFIYECVILLHALVLKFLKS